MTAMRVTLSWIRPPFECSPSEWVALESPSATMLLLNVMMCDVLLRQSSGVVPWKRGPDADRFSSVPHVAEQWSTMTL